MYIEGWIVNQVMVFHSLVTFVRIVILLGSSNQNRIKTTMTGDNTLQHNKENDSLIQTQREQGGEKKTCQILLQRKFHMQREHEQTPTNDNFIQVTQGGSIDSVTIELLVCI
ncbi:hypothetical protein L6164_020658 [Bauhinia variegata]|uniref:Uncharacterized protein n=1 Tax=Bauhinia variegata TaxID=167791 RepID=A0ACB9MXC9_BAUVA|nr:hypothetical protein L6164_020658 [Bauhinia variegata]